MESQHSTAQHITSQHIKSNQIKSNILKNSHDKPPVSILGFIRKIEIEVISHLMAVLDFDHREYFGQHICESFSII
jgi:hypothetical protein